MCTLFSHIFEIVGQKNMKRREGGGWWSNSYGKNCKADPLCILELLDSTLDLAKFHPNRRDGIYHPSVVNLQVLIYSNCTRKII